jgi:hypothetical protein
VAAKYPYLIRHRRKWVVRMIVPADVRDLVGQGAFRISTGEESEHKAQIKAAPIIAALQFKIQTARETLRPPVESHAAALAARYRELNGAEAEIFILDDVIRFALQQGGHSLTDYGRRLNSTHGVAEQAIGQDTRNRIDFIIGKATPFLSHVEAWKPHAGLKPRPFDQALSSLKSFDAAVKQPIETLEAKHVQAWIDALISPQSETGLSAKTVARKIGEVRNYWRYLQSVQVVPEDRDPFLKRRIKDPANRRTTRDDERQKWQPSEVVMLWTQATANADAQLAHAIRLAAYSGARIEGVAQLRVSDIRIDPKSGIRFMRMADKSEGGDRDVPIHPMISGLLDDLVGTADKDGYLIHSTAKKQIWRTEPAARPAFRQTEDGTRIR